MKILLTNDDGIDSPGLIAMEEKLSQMHEILVVAPSGERSGYSNSLTFHGNVKIKKVGKNRYSCSGTPADCVHRTLHLRIDGFFPDMVVSGINIGPNLGTDIIYSGTAAAARQAAIMGIPGVAVSVTAFSEPFYFDRAAAFVSDNINNFFGNWNSEHFININVPSLPCDNPGVMITSPSRRFYREHLEHAGTSVSGNLDVSLTITEITHDEKFGSDSYAVENGMISISPVFIQPVSDERSGQAYKNIFCRG